MSDQDFDIFDSVPTQERGEFFKFVTVGDKVQGTYIDKREGVDSFGNEQYIYVLKTKDTDGSEKVWNVGIKKTNKVTIEQMAKVRFGQIVGFVFSGTKPSKRTPGGTIKLINVVADPRFIDKEWVKQHEEIQKAYESLPSTSPSPVSETAEEEEDEEEDIGGQAKPMSSGIATEAETTVDTGGLTMDAIEAVRNLAKSKGLVSDGMSVSEIDKKIVEFTGLPYAQENLTSMIVKLTAYTGR